MHSSVGYDWAAMALSRSYCRLQHVQFAQVQHSLQFSRFLDTELRHLNGQSGQLALGQSQEEESGGPWIMVPLAPPAQAQGYAALSPVSFGIVADVQYVDKPNGRVDDRNQ